MAIPAPAQNFAPTHSTHPSAADGARIPGTTLNLGPVSPPGAGGYQQNTSAQEMPASQRAGFEAQQALEQQGRSGSLGGAGAGVSGVVGGVGEALTGETAENAWNAVKGWVGAAGEKLAETEESVWRRINGK